MTADEFVRVARSLGPRNDALRRAGLNPADIAEIRRIYALPRLTKKFPVFPGDSCLHELLSQYDLSGFGFTALEFGRPVMTQNGILFARRESDPLMLRARIESVSGALSFRHSPDWF